MAQRRMFSLKIVDSDAFMDMPQSAQLLYFQLSMRADDDGFVANPKRIMKMVGSNDDDYKILIAKRFILVFKSGVCVIKHWLIHNYIQNDRYNPTVYLEERKEIVKKENGSYTERIQDVSISDTQVSIGEYRKGKSINTGEFFLFNKNTQKEENTLIFATSVEANQWAAKNQKKLGDDFFQLEVRQK